MFAPAQSVFLIVSGLLSMAGALLLMFVNQALYDITGSTFSFGIGLQVQLVLQLFVTLFVGGLADKIGFRRILVTGLSFFVFWVLAVNLSLNVFERVDWKLPLASLLLIIALYGPFVHQPLFLWAAQAGRSDMNRLYGHFTFVFQAAQVLGAFAAVPLLRLLDISHTLYVVFAVYGISFLSVIFLKTEKVPPTNRSEETLWKDLFDAFITKRNLAVALIIGVFPMVFTNFFNVFLPEIAERLGSKGGNLIIDSPASVLDAAYCLGCALAGFALGRIPAVQTRYLMGALGLFALFFFTASRSAMGLEFALVIAVVLGLFSSGIAIRQNVALQTIADFRIKGKLVAFQQTLNIVATALAMKFIF